MASGIQDTSLWLHNKLGTSNDSWIGGSIVAQLSPDILIKIQRCFQDLQPQVKLKLLLSFFHIPRRNLEQWRHELEDIIAVATDDSEPWVCMLGELMKTYPETGQLNSDISVPESNRKIFSDLLTDLKKALKKTADKKDIVLPLECHYLNKNAFLSVVGNQPQTTKHFSLRRKPKAAALRAELLTKSQEAANKMKSSLSGGFPVRKNTMPRKMSDVTPLKGIPARGIAQSGFRNPRAPIPSSRNANKKEGGVKLLDIADQPMGYAAAKKRKRQQEMEDAKKAAGEQQAAKEAAAKEEAGTKANTNPTPDYAAGLNPPTPAAPLPPPAYAPPTPTPIQAPPTPAYAPPTPALQVSMQQQINSVPNVTSAPTYTPLPGPPPNISPIPPQNQTLGPSAHITPVPLALVQSLNRGQNIFPAGLQSLEPLPQSNLPAGINVPQLIARVAPITQQQQQAHQQLQQQQQQQHHQQLIIQHPQNARIVQLPTQPIPQSRVAQIQAQQSRPPVTVISQPPMGVTQQTTRIIHPVQQPQAIMTAPRPPVTMTAQPQVMAQQEPQPQQPQRLSLTLTREQMLEAQEMFRTANKVTRPEKALILGFMAGNRNNPCPHLGNVVTIKLSEDQENVLQNDGTGATMIVETHFQMNYSTGEWKRIKKYRRLEE